MSVMYSIAYTHAERLELVDSWQEAIDVAGQKEPDERDRTRADWLRRGSERTGSLLSKIGFGKLGESD